MIDTSHANSNKKPENQPLVVADIARQISNGEQRIIGVMIESNLVAGRQDVVPGKPLTYGQSITDGCIDWETTVSALNVLADAVATRRNAPAANSASVRPSRSARMMAKRGTRSARPASGFMLLRHQMSALPPENRHPWERRAACRGHTSRQIARCRSN